MPQACCIALVLIAFATALPAKAAELYPSKPIRLIVPFPPGGLSDGLARVIGQNLSQDWAQQVVIDNRPGAGTTLAADLAAKARPDGYTLFFQDITTHGINAGLYRKLRYDALRDFVAVAFASASPLVLTINPSLPARSVNELVALARARPGGINYGSSGNGTILHLAGEMFNRVARVELTHVPYKGSPPAVNALVAGEVAIVFATTGSVIPQVEAGKVRALAVTTAQRSPLLPDLPAIAETLAGYDLMLYQGILAPAATPRTVIKKLNAQINDIVTLPSSKESWRRLGAEPVVLSLEDSERRYKQEVSKLTRLAVESGARAD
jgi:tripartite-type tricarboxylate transporter receptor subunit TctC